jgi:hypothetical protein
MTLLSGLVDVVVALAVLGAGALRELCGGQDGWRIVDPIRGRRLHESGFVARHLVDEPTIGSEKSHKRILGAILALVKQILDPELV